MAYKIAVCSSDGEKIDLKFGEVSKFIIYEVKEKGYMLYEIRSFLQQKVVKKDNKKCGVRSCSDNKHGCSGPVDLENKIAVIEDCRCIICKKIGFQAQRQLEKKAISIFDVECLVSQALEKIISYYYQIDHHEPFKIKN